MSEGRRGIDKQDDRSEGKGWRISGGRVGRGVEERKGGGGGEGGVGREEGKRGKGKGGRMGIEKRGNGKGRRQGQG